MAKITLQNASFHGFSFSCGPKRGDGGPVVVVEFSAPWTERNRAAGKWEEIPETVSGNIGLVPNELAATHIEFTPRGGIGFSIDCSLAHDFKCFVPTKEGVPRELRFEISTSALKAGRELEAYGRVSGEMPGTLKISHSEDANAALADGQQALEPAAGRQAN